MEKRQRPVERQIHTVRTWLDKAEQSYASDANVKGQMQLLLAKAEMQHLDEQHMLKGVRHSSWIKGLFCTLAVLGVVGALYWQPIDSSSGNTKSLPIVQVPWGSKESNSLSTSTEKNWLLTSWPQQEFVNKEQKNFFDKEPTQQAITVQQTSVEPAVVSTPREEVVASVESARVNPVQPVVNQQEIQRAVHMGGKSLRGTE